MMKIFRKIILILSIFIIILSLQWSANKGNDLEFEVIIDKMEDTDVVASLFYENFYDKAVKGYRTYLWKNKTIIKGNREYLLKRQGWYATYPYKSLKKLEKQMKLSEISNSLDKPIIFYGNT